MDEISKRLVNCGFHKSVETIERFLPDIRHYQHFPREHWKRIRSTNLMEQIKKEIKGRARVGGAFPSDESLVLSLERFSWISMKNG